ncbi:MAG: tetratricopeptide repeat protein [Bryobacterales bacterium]|nr:tetratricopeptide repeat protein [Bryobacterales bacterium]
MSRTPKKLAGSRAYREAWRAVNLLIRSDGSWSGRERDVCYRNLGDGSFADTSFVTGLDSAGDGRGFVSLDLNGDGALDFVEASRTAPRIRVLENSVVAEAGLMLELRGARQPDAIGAVAELATSRGRKLVRQVEAGSGYLTQSSRRLHFALPRGENPERLRIRWPEGAEQIVTAVPARGAYRLAQGAPSLVATVTKPVSTRPPAAPEQAASVWLTEPVPAPAMEGVTTGRKTLVNFWASWCPPCREEMKEWSTPESARRFAAAGLRVVVASVDEDARQRPASAPFAFTRPSAEELAAWNLFHRHLFDRRREIGLPTSFLLDERGRVLKVYPGVTASAQIAADATLPAATRRALPFAGIWLGEQPRRNFAELATALAEGGRPKESARYFDLALARAGGKAPRETLNNYAGVLLESGDLAKAETLLQSLQSGGAEHEEDVLANLGTLRQRQGRNEEARAAFEKLLAHSADDAVALNGLGSALFALQDLDGARSRFAEAVQVDPDHAGYRYNWASALAASGEFRAALREFEAVRARQGETAALSNNLGILYVETGGAAKGEAEFRRAMALAPKDAGGYLNLATLYQKTNRAAQAREVLRELLRVVPGQPQALRMLEQLR